MHRKLSRPMKDGLPATILEIEVGGTSVPTKPEVIELAQIELVANIDKEGGPVSSDANGKMSSDMMPPLYTPKITGVSTVVGGELNTFTITNYSDFVNYTLTALNGTVSRNGNIISYTSPLTGTTAGFTLNNKTVNLTNTPPTPSTPSITVPVNNATGVAINGLTISASAFNVPSGVGTHAASQWQVATDAAFTNMILNTGDSANLNSTVISNLNYNTAYYVRVKHKSSTGVYSEWSATSKFTTMVQPVIATPSIVSPGNGAGGVSRNLNIYSSSFGMYAGSDTHVASQWEISLNSNFSQLVGYGAGGDSGDLTSHYASLVLYSTTYYARVRHKGLSGVYSDWSPTCQFTTEAAPVTTTPSISSMGTILSLSNLATNAYRYRVYITGNATQEANFGGASSNYGNGNGTISVSVPQFNTSYEVRVSVYSDAGGWSGLSNAATVMASQ